MSGVFVQKAEKKPTNPPLPQSPTVPPGISCASVSVSLNPPCPRLLRPPSTTPTGKVAGAGGEVPGKGGGVGRGVGQGHTLGGNERKKIVRKRGAPRSHVFFLGSFCPNASPLTLRTLISTPPFKAD
eukprot:Hpha_TRINITY_DN14154_c0_g1::TRINITY_DN14154_c0_g1_i1::g.10942::m.10942